MRIAYGELIGGLSGDMFVAALIELGLPLARLKNELKKIPTLRFELKTSKQPVHTIRATRFHVICPKQEAPRSWRDIRRLIERSRLGPEVKAAGIEIFAALAQAEAKIHGIAVDKVHFHEVGATDSIIDILAAAVGIRELKFDKLYFSPIPLGHGLVRSNHGRLPLPGPATLELLKGLPTFGVDVEGETVTPTGAAIIRALAQGCGPAPSMTVEKIGYAAGQKEFLHRPNLFRLSVGVAPAALEEDEMVVIETNIDDMNPQYFDHVMDRLFAAGARDVFLAPIQMKKNRPATLLTVICEPARRDLLARTILQESSSIGVRYYPVGRLILKRAGTKVKTRYGELAVKIVDQPDGTHRVAPEYDDLKRLAAANKLPLKIIHDEAMKKFRK
jgi:uncharacterized protein (TIGR00299 family) protein